MPIVTPKRGAEAQKFLDANLDITSVHVIWTDMCGVIRGKILRRDEVVPAWNDGRFLPISALVLDMTGQDVPETGLVFDEGDRDVVLWPIPGTFVRIPWIEEPSAQYTAHVCDLDGVPHYADPRNALQSVVQRFKEELGMNPVGAVELEFYLMDRKSSYEGVPTPPRSLVNESRPRHYQAYHMADLDDFAPFFKDLYAYCETHGLPNNFDYVDPTKGEDNRECGLHVAH